MVFNEYFSCIEGVSFIDGGNRVPGENHDLLHLNTQVLSPSKILLIVVNKSTSQYDESNHQDSRMNV
jgi:hypothetical protein